jgi:hypothetical protein
VEGYNVSVLIATGFTVSVSVLLTPLYVAVIVTVLAAETAVVEIEKAGEIVCPAATTTEVGTAATVGSLLVRGTTAPAAGAGPVSFTVLPVAATLPTTEAEATVIADRAAGFTVRTACFVTPL